MPRMSISRNFFFFNDTATTEIYTLSLHDALPISDAWRRLRASRESTQRRRAPPSAPRERSGRRRPPARGSSGTARTSRRSDGRSRLERYGRAALEGNRRPWQNPPMTSSGRLAALSVVVAIGAVAAYVLLLRVAVVRNHPEGYVVAFALATALAALAVARARARRVPARVALRRSGLPRVG